MDDEGRMTKGYAFVASPVVYGRTGKTTFMVNNDGVVFMYDYGEKTPDVFRSMTSFDPPKDAKRREY